MPLRPDSLDWWRGALTALEDEEVRQDYDLNAVCNRYVRDMDAFINEVERLRVANAELTRGIELAIRHVERKQDESYHRRSLTVVHRLKATLSAYREKQRVSEEEPSDDER